VAVTVVEGATGEPVGGVAVSGLRDGVVIARTTTGAAGEARLPEGVEAAAASERPYAPARAKVRDGAVRVALYEPRLQSPQYGGGPRRDRHVAGVRAGPPRGRPAWSFRSRTLIEFPPSVRDGMVVVGNNAGRVYALDADDGELRWARRQKGEIAASPAITHDRVYMASMDGSLVAYGLAGTTRWTFSTSGSPIESSPLVADGLVYVGAHDGRFHALDAETGRERWRFRAPGAIKGSAALAGGLVVVGDYGGNVHALDARTGAERWTHSGGVRFYGGPGVSGRTIVIGDVGGAVVALDARDGSRLWRHSTGSFVYSSPAIADGTVFIGSYDGRFRALDLASGAVRWSFDVGGRISGSATVVDGVVYVSRLYAPGQARRTYGLDTATGAVRWEGRDGRYSPAVGADRTLYLVGTRTLRAYPAPAP
jgi:outer membrane protein assembly factor BamB